jgi:glutamyl-tRNA synthetase
MPKKKKAKKKQKRKLAKIEKSLSIEERFNKKILIHSLSNAIIHNGQAQATSVLPKLFQEGLKREEIKQVIPIIQKTVNEINNLTIEEQKKKFESLNVKVKKKEKEKGLSDLEKVKNKVVMRFAPYPSGPLHIGNARPAILNDEYVKKYGGKLLLVIDDTIGSQEKQIIKEAYKLIPHGLDWLQVNYDKILYKSDRLDLYYKYAEQLIRKNKAYVCFCSSKKIHDNRTRKKECECRKKTSEENLIEWKKMLAGKYKEGHATLRIKTSMQHKNPAFRDRVLFRISNRTHPRVKKKYKIWPLLEMSWAVDDHLLGITHVLRGKDLMIESEMEKYIWKILGWKQPVLIHTGLVSITGAKISKSKSQKEVMTGKYIGWDDPRTWSLQSLEARGIKPEALRKFCISLGLTQTEVTVPIESLYKKNKKIIESSNRYFFIENPVKIKIKNSPRIIAKLPLHPDHAERGYRLIETTEDFYIAKKDHLEIKKSKQDIFRFMNLFNFKRIKHKMIFEFHSRELQPLLKAKLIHWLPLSKELIKTKIMMPEGEIVKGLAEQNVKNLEVGTIIQFERFGFCKLHKIHKKSKKGKEYEFWFAHR